MSYLTVRKCKYNCVCSISIFILHIAVYVMSVDAEI